MPLYDIQCEASGAHFDRHIKLVNFEEPIFCACGSRAKRLISRPMISVDQTGYTCPVTDKWVGSLREHRENLQRQNCRVLEPGEKELNDKFRAEQDERLYRKVEDTVEQSIAKMDSAKKERLFNEMSHNEVAIERG